MSRYLHASNKLKPLSLMRLTQIKDPEDLLKKFDEDDIIVESKFDGNLVQVIKNNGEVKIYSRRGEDITENFPHLIKNLKLINGDFIIGELVYIDGDKQSLDVITGLAHGLPQKSIQKQSELPGKVKLFLFDILFNKDKDVCDLPLKREENF